MTSFFFKLKKTIFLPISLIFGVKSFSKKRAVMHNFIRVSSTMAKSSDFHISITSLDSSSYCQGLTGTTAVGWHIKDKKCDINLTKNYCITISIQKISSIYKLIHQILGSHELNDQARFWPGPPKNHWNNF